MRSRRNSFETIIDDCLTYYLAPYVIDDRLMIGSILPNNFARATAKTCERCDVMFYYTAVILPSTSTRFPSYTAIQFLTCGNGEYNSNVE